MRMCILDSLIVRQYSATPRDVAAAEIQSASSKPLLYVHGDQLEYKDSVSKLTEGALPVEGTAK